MEFTYNNDDIGGIDAIQDEALNIYGKYDLEKSMLWMTEEYGEFYKAIRKNCSKDEITGEMGDLLAWILCMGNILGIKLSDAINTTFKKEIGRQLRVYSKMKYCTSLDNLKVTDSEKSNEKIIRIGLPKGNVKAKSLKLVEKILGKEVSPKQLSFEKDNICIMLLKHRDIPKMIERGELEIGISSYEWVAENESKVNIVKELDWCDTRIALIGRDEEKIDSSNVVRCITEFPNIAKKYFHDKNISAEVSYISGSSEACVKNLYDCCVDCVETAQTLKENNLSIKDVILESKMMVVSSKDIDKDNAILQKLCQSIEIL